MEYLARFLYKEEILYHRHSRAGALIEAHAVILFLKIRIKP